MCYYPYFRGRQNELIVIRENAEVLASARFVPIIEPVKSATNGLLRALTEISRAKSGHAIVIANPGIGDFQDNNSALESFIKDAAEPEHVSIGIRVSPSSNVVQIARLCGEWSNFKLAIIHCGFPDGSQLASALKDLASVTRHVFIDGRCSKLYMRHFREQTRVLVRDGFKKQRTNRDYPAIEPFSDLHVTFGDEGMAAFGDFLIAGDDYQESGGAAYAVAIHLTSIETDKDDEMYVRHFVSDRTDTPDDPAGKFAEALGKLAKEVERQGSPIRGTRAVEEFLELHKRGHFPGLGYVKKLSMQHHVETLANYFGRS